MMSKSNVARDLVWPTDPNILVRTVFLYVGQGSSAVVLAADNGGYLPLLVDINLDKERGGIDVPRFMADLLAGEALHAFVNTHPHDDHLRGVKELSQVVTIDNVWHSFHKPSKKYGERYEDLKEVIAAVKKAGGSEIQLISDASAQDLGDAKLHILSPTEALTDDVNEEKADERYARIHEQCGVLKIGSEQHWILFPGDADRCAFEQHIMKGHKQHLKATVLAASHHGSMTFFKNDKNSENEEDYKAAFEAIDPACVVISAPTQEESPHSHPDDEAVKIYEEKVGPDNLLHTGAERYCFICDIFKDGSEVAIMADDGRITEEYPLPEDDGGGDVQNSTEKPPTGPFVKTSPSSSPQAPSRYA